MFHIWSDDSTAYKHAHVLRNEMRRDVSFSSGLVNIPCFNTYIKSGDSKLLQISGFCMQRR